MTQAPLLSNKIPPSSPLTYKRLVTLHTPSRECASANTPSLRRSLPNKSPNAPVRPPLCIDESCSSLFCTGKSRVLPKALYIGATRDYVYFKKKGAYFLDLFLYMQLGAKKGQLLQHLVAQEELMARLPHLLEEIEQLCQVERQHLLNMAQTEHHLQTTEDNASLFQQKTAIYSETLSELNGKLCAQEEREQTTGKQMLSLQEQVATAQREQETLRSKLKGYKSHGDTRWALKKEELLRSPEFYNLVGDKVTPFLEKGFEGAILQFRYAGYPWKVPH